MEAGKSDSAPTQEEDYYLTPSLRQTYLLNERPKLVAQTPAEPSTIQWEPNLATYQARAARRLLAGGLASTLPAKWPQSIDSPLAWDAEDFQKEDTYVVELTSQKKDEINAAVAHFQG